VDQEVGVEMYEAVLLCVFLLIPVFPSAEEKKCDGNVDLQVLSGQVAESLSG